MNFLDLFVVVIAALGFIGGLAGKFPKKIGKLLIVVIAVAVAYFTCGNVLTQIKAMDASILPNATPGQTIGDFATSYISNLVGNLGIPAGTITGFVDGILKLLLFWLLCIVYMIALGIVGGIFNAIIFRKAKKGTAWKSLGIFGAAEGAIIAVVIILPIIILSPLIAEIDNFTENDMSAATKIVTESKVINFAKEKVLETDIRLEFLTYEKEVDGNVTQGYLYDDLKAVSGLAKMAPLLTGGDNPLATIATMSDEDLLGLFSSINESDTVKEMISGVIEGALEGTGLEIDISNVDFSKEGETFVAVKNNLLDVDENGEFKLKEEITEEQVADLTEALVQSDLIQAVAESSAGMLADVDEGTKTAIDTQLSEMVAEGTLTQDKYDTLMKLFEASIEPAPEN